MPVEPKEITRQYNGADTYMTSSSRVIMDLMQADQARFAAFDTDYTPAYIAAFKAAINAAETVVADTAVIDQLGITTEQVETAMDNARKKYAELKYFVTKAFPNSPATQGEFGLNDYYNIRKSHAGLVQLLDEMSKAAVKYSTQLVAKGYTAPKITELQTLRTALLNASSAQELAKATRPKYTEDRIITLNACYAITAQVIEAAQVIYLNDYAKRNQFVYLPSSSTSQGSFTNYSGSVSATSEVTITNLSYLADRILKLTNTSATPLTFSLFLDNKPVGVGIRVNPGETLQKLMSDFAPDGNNIVASNRDTIDGMYMVDIEDI